MLQIVGKNIHIFTDVTFNWNKNEKKQLKNKKTPFP